MQIPMMQARIFDLPKPFITWICSYNALMEYQRVIEIKSNHTPAINGIGWIYYNQGEFEKAGAQGGKNPVHQQPGSRRSVQSGQNLQGTGMERP
ncbi:MAG: hypothetical protein RBR01_04715 [Desulfobacterales bacterium]|jgi:hypothetical protein|nr:hypothetical protein [Desulfobacterales bacterium]